MKIWNDNNRKSMQNKIKQLKNTKEKKKTQKITFTKRNQWRVQNLMAEINPDV